MKSTKTYYKNSTTGELIYEIIRSSEVITNIPKEYYDLYSRFIGNEFDLTGFVQIKEKKFELYRKGRWSAGEINSFYNERWSHFKK